MYKCVWVIEKWRRLTFSVLLVFAVMLPSASTTSSFRKRLMVVQSMSCSGMYASIERFASVLSEFRNAASAM